MDVLISPLPYYPDEAPSSFLLQLLTKMDAGSPRTAGHFVAAIAELREQHPHSTFQFIPFTYASNGGLTSMLAIGS